MPKRTDIETILVIGSGPIVIGQACEFDYSGTQACKALREEGYRVVLVNSNPATIMTDPEMADRTYVEPLTVPVVERILERERRETTGGLAVLSTVGGQTGLNLSSDLAEQGILDKYDAELIGANWEAIRVAEDRELFKEAMIEIGLEVPHSGIAHSVEEALADRRRDRLSGHHPPLVYPGRHGRRHRLQRRRIPRQGASRPGGQPDPPDPGRSSRSSAGKSSSWR